MALASLDALKQWYFNQDNPTSWRIFRGPANKNYDAGMAKADTPEQAWEKLEAHLQHEVWEPGEYLTIRVYQRGNAQGTGSDMTYRPISKYHHSPQSAVSGIGANSQAYIAEQVQKEIEIYDLRRQVQDLEAAINDKQNVLERIVNQVVEHPNFDPNALVNGLAGMISGIFPKRAQVGVMGFDPGAAAAPPTGDEQAEAARITSALERLQAHFPEQPIGEVLEKLADFVDSNPVVAKNVLKNILE